MSDTVLQSATLHVLRITHKTCWVFVRLHTKDGYTGDGEATLQLFEDDLVNQANRLVPLLLNESQPNEFVIRHAPVNITESGIVSAIDQALWSLRAQANDQSLAQTLGVCRERIPVYANINRRTEQRTPEGFAASALTAMSTGHLAFKMAPFDEVNTEICTQGDGVTAMQAGLDRIATVREVVGPSARLMVDCHWRFDEATAQALNEAAAKMGVYWIETPLPEIEANIPALARLHRQCNALGMYQAGLEQNVGWDTIRPYCEGNAYDVVMPDMKYIGGIEEMQRTAAGCADFGAKVSPHNPSGPICHAASLQMSAVLDAFDMLELQFDESPLFNALVNSPFTPVEDGHTTLPPGPGLGAVLDEDVLQSHLDRPASEWHI